jgi:hypothetical protein
MNKIIVTVTYLHGLKRPFACFISLKNFLAIFKAMCHQWFEYLGTESQEKSSLKQKIY